MIPESPNIPIPRLQSLSSISAGSKWVWPRVDAENEWVNWYHSLTSSLYTATGTIDNGLKANPASSIMTPPIFANASDFYHLALTSEAPKLWATSEGDQAEIDVTNQSIFPKIAQALWWWSIKGRAALLLRSNNRLSAIDPSAVFPVTNPFDVDEITHHVIAYPYRSPQSTSIADRIRFIVIPVDEGQATYEDHEYGGATVGSLIDEGLSDAVSVVTWGNGSSFYPHISPLVRELAIRLTSNNRLLNRLQDPHLQVPANYSDDDDEFGGESKVLYTDEEGTGYRYLVWDGDAANSFRQISILIDAIHENTGAPAFAEGGTAAFQESGRARDRALFKAMSKIRVARQESEVAIRAAINHIMSSEVSITIDWPVDPFASINARRLAASAMFTSGVPTRGEARQMAGLSLLGDERDDYILDSVGTSSGATPSE